MPHTTSPAVARQLVAPRIVVEYTACPLCDGLRAEPVLRARDPLGGPGGEEFQVVRCGGCRLHFTNPRPTAETIHLCYPADYRPHAGEARHDRPLRSWYPHDWLKLPPSNEQPRLLDFGCGGGHFLAAMARQGWDVTGLDMSGAAVRTVRESLGLTAVQGSLANDALEPASFDMVTMWHALEHVHDPRAILREARRLLRPAGRLVLAVPNFDGWPRRWFGPVWYGLELPRHITHFDPANLKRFLEEAGFRVTLRFPRHADWLRSSALRARRQGCGGALTSMFRFKPLARLGAWLCQRLGRPDAIMALAEVS